jgi:hypothetical protein
MTWDKINAPAPSRSRLGIILPNRDRKGAGALSEAAS